MGKGLAAGTHHIETALNHTHPYRAVGCGIHGIYGVACKRRRVVGIVGIICYLQVARHELNDTSHLGTYPCAAVLHQQAVDEVAAKRIRLAHTVKVFHGSGAVVDDVDTAERAHKQPVLGRNGKTGSDVML